MKKILTKLYRYLIISIFISFYLSQVNGQVYWTPKANIPCAGRSDAADFSIGQKGYFGCGNDTNYKMNNDFWEWDQSTNTWTQKASLPGLPRKSQASFSIGTKGYLCVGVDSTPNLTNEVWEWDQTTNTWTQKSDFPGPCRAFSVGFSIGSKGYLGTGEGCGGNQKDFWEYDPASDTWTQKADFGGLARYDAQGFSIGNKGYIGGGIRDIGPPFWMIDFWEYDPVMDTWTQKANLPEFRCNAAGFSIGNSGYFCTGVNDISRLNDLIEWDQSKNIWTHKASLPANTRIVPIGFSIGNQGYVGMGVYAQTCLNDFWEYTPEGVGVNEINSESRINVYPNPVTGNEFTVSLPFIKTGTLQVINLLGEALCTYEIRNTNKISINGASFKSGCYLLRVKSDNSICTGKLVKQ